jgi:GT2 family glycosyltransferase
MRDIVCIVITFNGLKWIDRCINSLQQSAIKNRIIVIDNGSTDGTQYFIRSNFSKVELIQNVENIGFGKSNNQGIKKAIEYGAEYVFLLNQDAWVEEDTIEKLVLIADKNSQFGVISPIHLTGDKSKLDYWFSTYLHPENTPSLVSDIFLKKAKEIYHSNFVNAAAWLISTRCLKKVGGFDPIFFQYGEDVNFCHRVFYHGFKVGVCPGIFVCHDREGRESIVNKKARGEKIDTMWLIQMTDIRSNMFYKYYEKLKNSYKRDFFTSLLKLKFKRLLNLYQQYNEKRKYYYLIEKSRAENSGEGMTWL